MNMVPNSADTSVLVIANCIHHSLALALREAQVFSEVVSVELYSMSGEEQKKLVGEVGHYAYVLTLEHCEDFGPLSTVALRQRLGGRLYSLPTPFFSGLMPDMAYLRYGGEIARTTAVLGDYHSGLILEEVRAGFPLEEIVRRYVSGEAFDRIDIQGVWDDNMAVLKAREENTDIAITPFIERTTVDGTIGEQFLSFNHPAEGMINYIAQEFIQRTVGLQDGNRELVTQAMHNLYADAFWPLHHTVAKRLGLPQPTKTEFKQPARLGGQQITMAEFVRRSVDFFTSGHDPKRFVIATPHFLSRRISPAVQARDAHEKETRSKPITNSTPKKIILTHFGRSGSTVVAELLKQHSRIAWLDEYFSLKWISDRAIYDYTLQQMLDMVDREVVRLHAQDPDLMVGHEIKLMNFLQNPGCNMIDYARATANQGEYVHIVLRRRNILKRLCSLYKAAQTKVYHVKPSDQGYGQKTFRIDFDNLVDYDTGQTAASFPELISKALNRENEVLANYQNVGVNYLELIYEDDIELDPLLAYRKIIDLVGLDYELAQVSLGKTSRGLKNELENYDQLAEQVEGSEYVWMLPA